MRKAIERIFIDDAGNPSHMVYIPPFKYTAGGNTRILGGFWMDKYPCSHPNATATDRGTTTPNSPGTTGAVSQPRKVPWTDIDWNNAKVACQNRTFNGEPCHLTTPEEWAAVALLAKLMGTIPHGNNSYGKDVDFPDEVAEPDHYMDSVYTPGSASYPYYGNLTARTLVGTGPRTWAHNHDPSGVFDLNGTVWEWIDLSPVDGAITINGTDYLIYPTQGGRLTLAQDIDAVVTTIPFVAGSLLGVDFPASGTIFIGTEQITYTGYDTTNNQFTGCTRGANGTTAAAHSLNDPIFWSPGGQNSGQRAVSMRTELDIMHLAIPAEVSSGGSAEWGYDGYWHYRSDTGWAGTRAARRGGTWTHGSVAGVFALDCNSVPSSVYVNIGFRACKSI